MNEVETVHFFFNKRKISLQELKNEFCKYFNSFLQCWYWYLPLRLDLFEVEVKFVLLEGLDTLGAFSEISTSTTDKHTSETFFFI